MTVLTNPKHEAFSQEVAIGRTMAEAYRTVYAREDRQAASRLRQRGDVSRRIGDICATRAAMARTATEKAAEQLQVTTESLIAEADEVRQKALEAGQYAACISAIKEKGILAGVRVEKRDTTFRSLGDMTDDELENIARGGGEGAAAPQGHSSKPH